MDPSHDSGEDMNKLFVGGLGWNTSKEQVQEYFERFGPVADVIVLRNPQTGQSRGFGFVSFVSHESATNAGNMKSGHMIDGKEVDVKSYSSKIHEMKRKQKFDNSMKVFIGGIPPGMTDEEIIDAFKKFGGVLDFTNMMDETRSRSRGFGFLTFEKPESIQRALAEHWVTINGKQLEVKPAQFNVKRSNPQGGDMSSAYGSYGQASLSGYPSMSSYMPYYDPYSGAAMGGEEDYYGGVPAAWSMNSGTDPSWGQDYNRSWQQRAHYGAPGAADYSGGYGVVNPGETMHAGAMGHQEDGNYGAAEEDPYAMFHNQYNAGQNAGMYPPAAQAQAQYGRPSYPPNNGSTGAPGR